MSTPCSPPTRRKPDWLKVKLPAGGNYRKVLEIVSENKLHTICQSGNCPNMAECWGAGTATFMILGNVCTRSCTFCAVATGRPPEYDEGEPERVSAAIKKMQVKHAVITSVNRDERKDRGADIWHRTVRAVKEICPATTLETLIPDVKGTWPALYHMISAGQEVVSHNMETVERLYRRVRPQAKYTRSLTQIQRTKDFGKRTKSGIMLGLGETKEEVLKTMDDLVEHGPRYPHIGTIPSAYENAFGSGRVHTSFAFCILQRRRLEKRTKICRIRATGALQLPCRTAYICTALEQMLREVLSSLCDMLQKARIYSQALAETAVLCHFI